MLDSKPDQESNPKIPAATASFDMLILAGLWIVSLLIVWPVGDFPLNDDWSYGLAVKQLIEQGDFRPTGWTSMPLITQALWGALFSLPGGFSFDALRLSTLVIGLLGILGLYLLMRELGRPRILTVVAALTLGFTPAYYALANTFMTDVPFIALITLAAFFFVRNLQTDSRSALVCGTLLAVAATLSRQLAVAVPVAFAMAWVLKYGLSFKSISRAVIPPTLCLLALLAFQQWLTLTGRLPALYHLKTAELAFVFRNPLMLLGGIYNIYVILLYLGWFLLPVLIFTFAGLWSAQRRLVIRLGFATGVGLAMAALLSGHFLMPTATNIIDSAGIGPFTLHDTYILNLAHVAPLPVGFWLVITLISYLGAAGLVVAFWLTVRELAPDFRPARLNGYQAANTFLLLCAIIYLLPLLVGNIFDRYLIPAMPFLAASLSAIPPRSIAGSQRLSRLTAGGLLLIMIGFSVLGTRDYFSWNRARWAALADLTADGVPATMIDGGFEFNGLYLYDPAYQRADPKSWWWVAEDTYQLGFGAVPGYTILRRYPYQRWLPPRSEAILVLKKDGATSRVVEGPMREE